MERFHRIVFLPRDALILSTLSSNLGFAMNFMREAMIV